jgi:hypothetical protein
VTKNTAEVHFLVLYCEDKPSLPPFDPIIHFGGVSSAYYLVDSKEGKRYKQRRITLRQEYPVKEPLDSVHAPNYGGHSFSFIMWLYTVSVISLIDFL